MSHAKKGHTIFFGNPDHDNDAFREAIEHACSAGNGILRVRQGDDGIHVEALPTDEFLEVTRDLNAQRRRFLEGLMSQDFGALEDHAMNATFRGHRTDMIIGDELYGDIKIGFTGKPITLTHFPYELEPEKEQSIQVGNHLVKPNKKTKGKAHALPFYLGSKRRY